MGNQDTDSRNFAQQDEYQSPVFELLDLKEISYEFVGSKEKEALRLSRNFLQTQLLQDEEGELLVIHFANRLLDFPQVCRQLTRDLEFVELSKSSIPQFYDEILRSYPAVPEVLMVDAVLIDSNIKEYCDQNKKITFPVGRNGTLIRINSSDFNKICNFLWEAEISAAAQDLPVPTSNNLTIAQIRDVGDVFTSRRMKARVNETFEMPIMPPMADELLKLRVDPTACSKSLAKLASKDPSLSAQLVSWACSPYYGYPGKITSVEDAIIKVLGFDLVMNIALGIAIGQVMRVPNEGPIGLSNYWRASVYSASIIEEVTKVMPVEKRPFRGLAYLCGLLHNFGLLLLGQVFPPQYFTLNQMMMLNDEFSLESVQQYLFNTNHRELGKWLMQSWHMPEELIRAIEFHNDPNYDDDHAVYVALVVLANRLLYRKGVGFEETGELNPELLERLGFENEAKPLEILENIWENSHNLDNVIKLLIS